MFVIIHDSNNINVNGRRFYLVDGQLFDSQTNEAAPDAFQTAYANERSSLAFKKLKHIVLGTMMKTKVQYLDRWCSAIVTAAKKAQARSLNGTFEFKDIRFDVCMALGCDNEDDARRGFAYHPYKGTRINVSGYIATWIEERSPHSRQRYFKGGRRVSKWDENTHPLMFVNEGLARANDKTNWAPFVETKDGQWKRNYVLGSGWRFDPVSARAAKTPSEEVLAAAETMYHKKGMQGHRVAVEYDQVQNEYTPNTTTVMTGVALATAAFIGFA